MESEKIMVTMSCTASGANVCVRRPLEVKGKGIKAVGAVADKAWDGMDMQHA
jgi:hypothetical protein